MFMTSHADHPITAEDFSGKLLSIMYHNVVPDDADLSGLTANATSYFVTASKFRAQLELMKAYTVVSLNDLTDPKIPATESNAPLVHLNFDDGWAGSFELAADILAEFGFKATIFVTTGLIGKANFVTSDQLKRFPNEQLQIGSHTVSHPFLVTLGDQQLKAEMEESKKFLEDLCQVPVRTLSIPHGAIDARVQYAAFAAGYEEIFTSKPGLNPFPQPTHRWRRVAIGWNTSTETMQRYLDGNLLKERIKSRALELPKKVLGRDGYHKVRGILLGDRSDD